MNSGEVSIHTMTGPAVDPFESLLEHAIHRQAFAYWRSLCIAIGGLPGRQDIDPVDIPSLLPWMNLVEVHDRPDGLHYRHRLIGTGIVQMRNCDNTGRWFHEIYGGEILDRIQREVAVVVRTGTPTLYRRDLTDVGKPYRLLTALILPLASNHQRVDMLMSVSQYD